MTAAIYMEVLNFASTIYLSDGLVPVMWMMAVNPSLLIKIQFEQITINCKSTTLQRFITRG